jgi:hypothetical protein
MARKHAIISVSLVCGLAALAGIACWSLGHKPDFYEAALNVHVAPEVRREQAKRFIQTTSRVVDQIRFEERWTEEFSEEDVNSWLAEELPDKFADWLPPEISEPRIKFDEDVLHLAFRARDGSWEGVVSAKIGVRVVSGNQLALEIQSLRAGLLPIPADDALSQLLADMRELGWRVQWQRSSRGDVLLVDLAGDSSSRPFVEAVELRPGLLRISGTGAARIAGSPDFQIPGSGAPAAEVN